MSAELQSVLDAALKLSDDDREALAERLWESLDDEEADEGEDFGNHPFAAEWDEEIRQRLEEMRSGTVRAIPWEEVQKLMLEDLNGPAN